MRRLDRYRHKADLNMQRALAHRASARRYWRRSIEQFPGKEGEAGAWAGVLAALGAGIEGGMRASPSTGSQNHLEDRLREQAAAIAGELSELKEAVTQSQIQAGTDDGSAGSNGISGHAISLISGVAVRLLSSKIAEAVGAGGQAEAANETMSQGVPKHADYL